MHIYKMHACRVPPAAVTCLCQCDPHPLMPERKPELVSGFIQTSATFDTHTPSLSITHTDTHMLIISICPNQCLNCLKWAHILCSNKISDPTCKTYSILCKTNFLSFFFFLSQRNVSPKYVDTKTCPFLGLARFCRLAAGIRSHRSITEVNSRCWSLMSGLQLIPKVCPDIQVSFQCRPVQFFHTELRKYLWIYDLCSEVLKISTRGRIWSEMSLLVLLSFLIKLMPPKVTTLIIQNGILECKNNNNNKKQ